MLVKHKEIEPEGNKIPPYSYKRAGDFQFGIFIIGSCFKLSCPTVQHSVEIHGFQEINLQQPCGPLLFRCVQQRERERVLRLFLIVELTQENMPVVRHDRAGGISVVFLCRFFAFHQRDQVLGCDRHLLADCSGCFAGRDSGYVSLGKRLFGYVLCTSVSLSTITQASAASLPSVQPSPASLTKSGADIGGVKCRKS